VPLELAEGTVDELIELGFLKFVPESDKGKVRTQLVESVQNRYLDSDWDEECGSADKRSYDADSEDLAEGGVGLCLRQMANVLRQEGVKLETVEDDVGEERYQVLIDGTPHLIYENSEERDQDTWTGSHKRLIEIVNTLLEAAGSEERAYGIYCGGNDGRVILLTPEMHNYLRRRTEVFDNRWMPLPADEIEVNR